jgi:hypothetical protein
MALERPTTAASLGCKAAEGWPGDQILQWKHQIGVACSQVSCGSLEI